MRQNNPNISELTRDELEAYVRELEEQATNSGLGRRSFLSKALGIAGAGALGIYSVDLASAAPPRTSGSIRVSHTGDTNGSC